MKKNYKKFYEISEIAKKLDLINQTTGKPNTHTLRFWEGKFKQIKPIKLNNNRRYYNEDLIEKLKLIKFLLKEKEISIKGVQKILNNGINSLDDYLTVSIRNDFIKDNLKNKATNILGKLKKLKKNGKKNTR